MVVVAVARRVVAPHAGGHQAEVLGRPRQHPLRAGHSLVPMFKPSGYGDPATAQLVERLMSYPTSSRWPPLRVTFITTMVRPMSISSPVDILTSGTPLLVAISVGELDIWGPISALADDRRCPCSHFPVRENIACETQLGINRSSAKD